ncbi:MAG: hypothetical protein NXI16_04820 [Alphaproteobacteria bacterium]|nr:hypothetical protein [Alphaproteobacteria bacterium]
MADRIDEEEAREHEIARLSLTILAESVSKSLGMHPVIGSIRMAAHTGKEKDFQDATDEFNALPSDERRSVAAEAESVAKEHVEVEVSEPEEVGDEFFDFFDELERDFEETHQVLDGQVAKKA